jgi:hypothetical protein
MQTILKLFDLAKDARTEDQLLGFIEDEADSCITNSDLLGAGEWLTCRLNYSSGVDIDATSAKILALWASPAELNYSPSGMQDLATNVQEFDRQALSVALVGLMARRPKQVLKNRGIVGDLTFRLSQDITKLFNFDSGRPTELCDQASIRLESFFTRALEAINLFKGAKCVTARTPAMDLLKHLRQLKPYLLVRERPLLSHADLLLGAGFREFCQSFERSETAKVVSLLPDVRQQAQNSLESTANDNSVVWHSLVKPIAKQLIVLTDEASRTCRLALTPSIKLATNLFKSDLFRDSSTSILSARIINDGIGNAVKVRLDQTVVGLKIKNPKVPFDLTAGNERIIELECSPTGGQPFFSIPLKWLCSDISGQKHVFADEIRLEQQKAQPDWALLSITLRTLSTPLRHAISYSDENSNSTNFCFERQLARQLFFGGQKGSGKLRCSKLYKKSCPRKVGLLVYS